MRRNLVCIRLEWTFATHSPIATAWSSFPEIAYARISERETRVLVISPGGGQEHSTSQNHDEEGIPSIGQPIVAEHLIFIQTVLISKNPTMRKDYPYGWERGSFVKFSRT